MQFAILKKCMNRHTSLGKKGEDIAVKYLLDSGYRIIGRNWRFHHKEIDIIATDETDVIFIEVKTRKDECYGEPEEAVDYKKQEFLIEAAEEYIILNNIDNNVRFDVISIILKPGFQSVNHIKNAFYPQF
jgi:putative endonuclease